MMTPNVEPRENVPIPKNANGILRRDAQDEGGGECKA